MKRTGNISSVTSVEEYIRLDESGPVRHEYFNGKLFEMPGETLLHNEICINVLVLLRSMLISKGWKVYMESSKVKIESEDIYLYPDLIVRKDELSAPAASLNKYIINNPVLIAEILSDTTRKYDSTDKFILYQKKSSLQYYLLIEPEKQVVIFYEKDDNGEWSAKTFTELTETIGLSKLDAEISLSNIYVQ